MAVRRMCGALLSGVLSLDQSRANYRGCSNRDPSKSALLRPFLMQAPVCMSGAKKRAHARLSVELQAPPCHSANSLEMNLTFSASFSS